jgi:hypothetical protein
MLWVMVPLVKEMVVAPGVMPATIPVEEPMVATAGALLLHVPVVVSVRVAPEPTHTDEGPVIWARESVGSKQPSVSNSNILQVRFLILAHCEMDRVCLIRK